jgi:hypothetical protein
LAILKLSTNLGRKCFIKSTPDLGDGPVAAALFEQLFVAAGQGEVASEVADLGVAITRGRRGLAELEVGGERFGRVPGEDLANQLRPYFTESNFY